jgi:acetyltransferase-like isoleucine patch superfamily enzyme
VTVGDGAVVGALNFVNGDLPDRVIAAGVPAQIIGYRRRDYLATAATYLAECP